jgi:predicted phosphodiesterase
MRIMTIGDIHSRKVWRQIVKDNIDSVDLIIFTGDFADPYEKDEDKPDFKPKFTKEMVLEEMKALFELKDKYPNKIVFLWGNHDLHYTENGPSSCWRYNKKICKELGEYFNKYKDQYYIAYQIENYVWTHAGISLGWVLDHMDLLYKFNIKDDFSNIADVLNKMLKSEIGRKSLFLVGDERGGYYFDSGGPVWSDSDETEFDCLPGIKQIVGHSQMTEIYTSKLKYSSITYVDNLGYAGKPYFLNI